MTVKLRRMMWQDLRYMWGEIINTYNTFAGNPGGKIHFRTHGLMCYINITNNNL